MQNPDYIKMLIALVPILLIFILMLAFKLASFKAGGIALISACLLAYFVWNMDIVHIGQAIAEGALSALMPICWVIFTAMLLYNLTVHCGAMQTIQGMLTRYAPDEPVQVLLIAFGFGSFLESVSGFGTPVVVPAAILILFGFEPLRAAVICLVANTLAVAFGVVGIPIITLANVTSVPVGVLSIHVSLQLFLFSVLLPFVLVFITLRSLKGMKKYIALCLATGITFAVVQTLSAWLLGPELPAIIASLATMGVIMLWQKRSGKTKPKSGAGLALQVKAWSAYIMILVLVMATRLIPALSFLDKAPFNIQLQVYQGIGAKPFTASLLTNPGTLILISAILFCLIYKISARDFFSTAAKTVKQVYKALLTVIFIVALAKVLSHSGMIGDIALGLAALSGSFFPLISPVIGCIGTFVTGSDTSSNILFGLLQKQTAEYIGVNASWLAAANTSGATIGKMISPLSIALASASTGLKGNESGILKITLRYAAAFIAIMAVFIYVTSFFVR